MALVIVRKSCAGPGFNIVGSDEPQEVSSEVIALLGPHVEADSQVESSAAPLEEIPVEQPKRKRKASAKNPRKSRKKKGE